MAMKIHLNFQIQIGVDAAENSFAVKSSGLRNNLPEKFV
jgi:hypothetical protein